MIFFYVRCFSNNINFLVPVKLYAHCTCIFYSIFQIIFISDKYDMWLIHICIYYIYMYMWLKMMDPTLPTFLFHVSNYLSNRYLTNRDGAYFTLIQEHSRGRERGRYPEEHQLIHRHLSPGRWIQVVGHCCYSCSFF